MSLVPHLPCVGRALKPHMSYVFPCFTCPASSCASRILCYTCRHVLRALCFECSRVLRVLWSLWRSSCALCLSFSRASRTLCFTCSRASRALCRTCSLKSCALRTLLPYVSCALRVLLPHEFSCHTCFFTCTCLKGFKHNMLPSISCLVVLMSCASCAFWCFSYLSYIAWAKVNHCDMPLLKVGRHYNGFSCKSPGYKSPESIKSLQ